MATVKEHYDRILADLYSWVHGGFARGIEKSAAFFNDRGIRPRGSGLAIDLGAGCGFQSIPLAQTGFSVIAIDLDGKLLTELRGHRGAADIKTIQDDLMNFDKHAGSKAELVVCMTDTLLLLESRDRVLALFEKVFASLEDHGKFIVSFRDLSCELSELDRFLPVKSDENIVFTCFLEFEPETVKVHDIVYRRDHGQWHLKKSFYGKLRLSRDWVERGLAGAGFTSVESSVDNGFVTVIAAR